MRPADFPRANLTLSAPEGMDGKVDPMRVHDFEQDGWPVRVSCWKLDEVELAQIQETGTVWLWVFGGQHPPVAMSVADPFDPPAG